MKPPLPRVATGWKLSVMMRVIPILAVGVCLAFAATAPGEMLITDSRLDFPQYPTPADDALSPKQNWVHPLDGPTNWYYGYYQPANDPDVDYSYTVGGAADDFVPLPDNQAVGISSTDFWGKTGPLDPNVGWRWDPADGYGFFMNIDTVRPEADPMVEPLPNIVISGTWAIRRWVSDYDGAVRVKGLIEDIGTPTNDGILMEAFLNGVPFDSATVIANGSEPFEEILFIQSGDFLDFAVKHGDSVSAPSPGPNDAGDDALFWVQITSIPEPGSLVLVLLGLAGFALLRPRRR